MAVQFKDYYKILGVHKGASENEIRKAYRTLVKKYHPDVNPNKAEAEKKMKEVNEAYHVLIDPEKRKRYDRLGADWQHYNQEDIFRRYGARRPGGGGHTFTFTGDMGDFSSFFRMFFGDFAGFGGAEPRGFGAGGMRENDPFFRTARPRAKPQPHREELQITLEEAYTGGSRALSLKTQEPCPRCEGAGVEERGRPCPACGGAGVVEKAKRLEVKIPAGVQDGAKLRMRGALGGERDLILVIKILPHSFFTVEGRNLRCRVPVTLSEALLGATIEVPTMKGEVKMKVPAGSSPGRVFRLRGLGLPAMGGRGRAGDQLCELTLHLPETLTREEKQAIQSLSKRETNPRRNLWRSSL